MDGYDARLFKKLVKVLGSEEQVQNAMILTGLIAESSNERLSADDNQVVLDIFEELVGCKYETFQRLVETL